ncbi:MAG: TIGR01777 family oxidoreductase [Armatimonadota bacterium]|nr:TIGR01777 family oxidoreductase [Armatimonadota bacterium]MDR7518953.1 TIGR01777 family oxidoreductase [Armatimonadota bacterium]MDR7548576.1 TIGR01777 family oxidoreductase [Armatimonadota bacterium]
MRRIVIAGASGMIGTALVAVLRAQGVEVARLARPPVGPDEIAWDPQTGYLDPAVFEGASAVVNLAGRSIARGRWTARTRSEILESRVRSTRLLVDTLRRADARPSVLVSASAIGFYGDRGDEVLDESSSPGRGFLADVTRAWEAEAHRAEERGVRVVCTRFGLILAREGGALGPLLPLFRMGLGGPLGAGRQWWSWIHLDDAVAAILAAIQNPALAGPVNVVGPAPVTNREFARTLAAVLRRPAVLPAPAFALRLVLGAMADEMVLASQRVVPAKLQAQGFAFRWAGLRAALEDLLTR